MKVKTYEVFDYTGLLLNSDHEGEKYKYVAIRKDLITGEKTRFDREAMFLNRNCFLACLDRWNEQSKNRKPKFRWTYNPVCQILKLTEKHMFIDFEKKMSVKFKCPKCKRMWESKMYFESGGYLYLKSEDEEFCSICHVPAELKTSNL